MTTTLVSAPIVTQPESSVCNKKWLLLLTKVADNYARQKEKDDQLIAAQRQEIERLQTEVLAYKMTATWLAEKKLGVAL